MAKPSWMDEKVVAASAKRTLHYPDRVAVFWYANNFVKTMLKLGNMERDELKIIADQ